MQKACGGVGFDTRENIWFAMKGEDLFKCDGATVEATWMNVWLAVLPACVLWGGGTAAGEIPPYWISFLAAKAGEENDELLELETEDRSAMNAVKKNIHEWKVWMIGLLKTHGFLGLVAMAAWPNAAFDLCGICCGTFMMPFWHFFGATFIGKALMKAPAQGAVFSTLFSEGPRMAVVHFIAPSCFPAGGASARFSTPAQPRRSTRCRAAPRVPPRRRSPRVSLFRTRGAYSLPWWWFTSRRRA